MHFFAFQKLARARAEVVETGELFVAGAGESGAAKVADRFDGLEFGEHGAVYFVVISIQRWVISRFGETTPPLRE